MKSSDFVVDSIDGTHYKCNKIIVDSDNCFQYAVIVALHHKNIVKNLQKYQKLNLLQTNTIEKKEIFHYKKKDLKKFKSNNNSVALNVLFSSPYIGKK